MKRNRFWVLEKKLKLEKKGEVETQVERKKKPIIPPDEEWSFKEYQESKKSTIDDSIQASVSSSQENTESTLPSEELAPKKIEKKVTNGTLDFKFSLRVRTSNSKDEQPIGEIQSNQQFQGQPQNGQPSQGQPQGGQSTQGQTQNGQPTQGEQQPEEQAQGEETSLSPVQNDENSQGQLQNEEPQNNRAKQLFSSVKRFDEGTDKSWGFVLSTEDDGTDIPDSVINMLIEKFLNQRFLPTNTDLNTRQNNMKQENGDLKLNIPDLVRHKVTKDLNKMLYDKYGYADEDGKGEDIPLSFYFDLSGSMSSYSRLLSLIAIKLMANKVKVLFGYNERIYYQIDKVPKTFTAEDFRSIIEKEMKYSQIKANPRYKGVEIKEVNRNINEYLREKKAKRLTAFTDFDPKREIEDLSKDCEIWWFCFEERSSNRKTSMENFKGHFYNTTQLREFSQHLKNISSRVYEKKQRRIREEGGIEH